MIPLLSADEMRALEERAIRDWGIPSLVLQEHAAAGALELLPRGQRIQVLAGPGTNGGDALALARLARLRGEWVEVWTLVPEPRWKGDAALQASLWEGLGGGYRHVEHPAEALRGFRGWVVDGILGLGSRLPLSGAAEAWVRALQDAQSLGDPGFRVLSLDLPTGLDPSSGDGPGPAVRAAVTACFGHLKRCHGLRPARDLCGEIHIVPIPLNEAPEARVWRMEAPTVADAPWDAHKRERGHVGIRAGTPGMSGAAVLAALGALRAGAGLVTVLPDPAVREEVASQVPEAMVRPWEGQVPEGVDVLLAGPGGVTEPPAWRGPLVLDASALRPGEGARWLARPDTVLTPHPGEFGRLFGEGILSGRGTDARLAAVGAVASGPGVLVLKGAQSLVAGGGDEAILVNGTGHGGLATGGTGDFLAGMVAAAVGRWATARGRGDARPGSLKSAVAEAVWLHGAAADRLGPGPLLVRDLGESLQALLRDPGRRPGRD
ncbi:MAG: bifunctional ADP-dependent NAD(P)H-hydrate dehydratase/NAD(P)H-hydrate epimerase [Acidobacteria bacterium]|nr:bifunctional ADP-dependent NAD(P)H-hydrate dehydratase/NAD(P)H-hydrate epimerase [Acidobacteriota bacterium]